MAFGRSEEGVVHADGTALGDQSDCAPDHARSAGGRASDRDVREQINGLPSLHSKTTGGDHGSRRNSQAGLDIGVARHRQGALELSGLARIHNETASGDGLVRHNSAPSSNLREICHRQSALELHALTSLQEETAGVDRLLGGNSTPGSNLRVVHHRESAVESNSLDRGQDETVGGDSLLRRHSDTGMNFGLIQNRQSALELHPLAGVDEKATDPKRLFHDDLRRESLQAGRPEFGGSEAGDEMGEPGGIDNFHFVDSRRESDLIAGDDQAVIVEGDVLAGRSGIDVDDIHAVIVGGTHDGGTRRSAAIDIDRVVVGTSVNCRRPTRGIDDIIAGIPGDRVGAAADIEDIVLVTAAGGPVSSAQIQNIVARTTVQGEATAADVEGIDTVVSIRCSAAAAEGEPVVASLSLQRIVAHARNECVVAAASLNRISIRTAIQGIVPAAGFDSIVAGTTVNDMSPRSNDQEGVIAGPSVDFHFSQNAGSHINEIVPLVAIVDDDLADSRVFLGHAQRLHLNFLVPGRTADMGDTETIRDDILVEIAHGSGIDSHVQAQDAPNLRGDHWRSPPTPRDASRERHPRRRDPQRRRSAGRGEFDLRFDRGDREADREQTHIDAEIDATINSSVEAGVAKLNLEPAVNLERAKIEIEAIRGGQQELPVGSHISIDAECRKVEKVHRQIVQVNAEDPILNPQGHVPFGLEEHHPDGGVDVDLGGPGSNSGIGRRCAGVDLQVEVPVHGDGGNGERIDTEIEADGYDRSSVFILESGRALDGDVSKSAENEGRIEQQVHPRRREFHLEPAQNIERPNQLELAAYHQAQGIRTDRSAPKAGNASVIAHIQGLNGLLEVRGVDFELERSRDDERVAPQAAGAAREPHLETPDDAVVTHSQETGGRQITNEQMRGRVHAQRKLARGRREREGAGKIHGEDAHGSAELHHHIRARWRIRSIDSWRPRWDGIVLVAAGIGQEPRLGCGTQVRQILVGDGNGLLHSCGVENHPAGGAEPHLRAWNG